MNNITKEDAKNIIELIKLAPITGKDALIVAGLIYKLDNLFNDQNSKIPTPVVKKETPEVSKSDKKETTVKNK